MDVKQLQIDEIGLSNRSTNALQRAGVFTVGDMLALDEETLYKVRNLGKKSVEEILLKIAEYQGYDEAGGLPDPDEAPVNLPEDFEAWLQTDEGQTFTVSWLREQGTRIDALELLSARAYNLLTLNGYGYLYEIAFLDTEALGGIPRMDERSAGEITRLCRHYLRDNQTVILGALEAELIAARQPKAPTAFEMRLMPEYHDSILRYVQANDVEIIHMGLSVRVNHALDREGMHKLSEIIFMTPEQFRNIRSMGNDSVEQLLEWIRGYCSKHEARLTAWCAGDEGALWDDADIREKILKLYQEEQFGGLSLQEMTEKLKLPEQVTQERLKCIIGSLLAEKKLEYVDFRCYRVYEKLADYLKRCTAIHERERYCIEKRLQGCTLEEIAQADGITRERVRQIVRKGIGKAREAYTAETGVKLFDEDYFRYLYETYDFEKQDASQWLGVPPYIWNYLSMIDVKQGSKDLQEALNDHQGLDAGMRLKIKNYLNRNKIYVDGVWVEKKRSSLERVAVRKFCTEDVPFEDFAQMFNAFLEQEKIPYDEGLYYTETVIRTRKNYLAEARFVLWKHNELIRYYDIDGRDYTELLDTLNLDVYENVELSTRKFMEDYPEIMEKYDIRDPYELHNLLRKILPEGSYHDFHLGRMPSVKFGTFDRDGAILNLLIDNAPINVVDLCELIRQEYGFDPQAVQANYLQPFADYYHQGVYSIDQKQMPYENKKLLRNALTEDFYYLDEIRKIYRELIPGADLEEINPYNLKNMGFQVRSKYVLQNHASLEDYFRDLLTREDITDLGSLRKRFTYIQMFSHKLMEMKKSLEIIEFEPGMTIHFRRLERSGVTIEMLRGFCDAASELVEDGTYFSVQSLKQGGFDSDLFELGFSDWFYANLLIADPRLSYAMMFGNLIFYKGKANICIKDFIVDRIQAHGSVDTYDLMNELTDQYGCRVSNRSDIVEKIQNTEVYHDIILDRLYANAELYYRELDALGGD